MSMTFTVADELRPNGDMSPNADPAKSTLRYMPFLFGGAFIYDPKSGELPFQNSGVSLSETLGSIFPRKKFKLRSVNWAA